MNDAPLPLSNIKQTVWMLTRTESYGVQCTGFSETTSVKVLWSTKPTIEQIAPMISEALSPMLGDAIAQVVTLLKTGTLSVWDVELDLKEVHLGTDLEKDQADD